MAQTIKSVKQKQANGLYSQPIPFGAKAVNIDMENGYDLETTLGNIDVVNKGTAQAQLDKHTQDIAANKAAIGTNDVDIANLQTKTSTNETAIAANKADIEANEKAIAKNAEDILSNATSIANNDADILALQNRATDDEALITANTKAIESNDSDIEALQNRASQHESKIEEHTTAIANLDTKIDTQVNILNQNIESIEGAFNGDLTKLTTRVGNNENQIAYNTSSIAKNTDSINTNTTDITALKEKDVGLENKDKELQAAIESNDADIVTINSTLDQHAKDITDRVTKAEAAPFVKGIEYNGSTYTFTFTMYDGSTQTVELPLENLIERGYFDTETEEIVLVLSTGEEVKIPAASLVDEYTGKENEQIRTAVANNVVEAILKTGSVDETFLTTELQTRLTNMEDKYTKAEVDELLSARSEFVEVETW